MLNPDMGGGVPTPKKKKRNEGSVDSSASSINSLVNVPSQGSSPKAASKPNSSAYSISNLFKDKPSIVAPKPGFGMFKPLQSPTPQFTPSRSEIQKNNALGTLGSELTGHADPSVNTSVDQTPKDRFSTAEELQEWLRNFNKAPKGYQGPELPERKKFNKNGQLRDYWDQDYINSMSSNMKQGSFEQNYFLNGILEKQLKDREEFLLGKVTRKTNRILDVLDQAQKGAFSGEDYNVLANKLKKNPNFLNVPQYDEQFGVDKDSLEKEWLKQSTGLSGKARDNAFYRMSLFLGHYDRLKTKGNAQENLYSYAYAKDKVDDALSKYKKTLDFNINGKDDDRKSKAQKAMDALNPNARDNKDQAIFDAASADLDPRQGHADLGGLLGGSSDAVSSGNEGRLKAAQDKIKKQLGVNTLPTVRQMLAMKVQDGSLDPDDTEAVKAWRDRFSNPNGVDTLAMYAGFALHDNPSLKDDPKKLEDFVNAPLKTYSKKLQEQNKPLSEEEQRKAFLEDIHNHDGFVDGFTDGAKMTGEVLKTSAEGFLDWVTTPFRVGKNALVGDDLDVMGKDFNAIGFTFDKLARPLYAFAGMANAVYQMDREPDQGWANGHSNFLTGAIRAVADPLSYVTGHSYLNSVDDFFQHPGDLKSIPKAGYDQFFRGSNLPGLDQNITPIMFSNVIANNAARDEENNIYDKNWYQHVAGFGLDFGLDPLNFVGVGVVNDVLKLPVRINNGLAESAIAGGTKIKSYDFLSHIRNMDSRDRGYVHNKAFRAREALKQVGDVTEGVSIAPTGSMYPVGIEYTSVGRDRANTLPSISSSFGADTKSARVHITEQLQALKAQEQQFINDSGIQHLYDRAFEISDKLGGYASSADLRVQRLAARLDKPISIPVGSGKVATSYVNRGGKIWSRFLNPLEDAARNRGFSYAEYATNPETGQLYSKAARYKHAEEELARWDEIGGLTPAKRAELEAHMDTNFHDAELGKDMVTRRGDVKAYLKSGEYNPKVLGGFDPVHEFAGAMGWTKEKFLEHFQTSDVYDALVMGPRMYTASDPAAAAQLIESSSRIRDAQNGLERLRHAKGEKADRLRKAHAKALQIGYSQSSEVTLAGSMRYLEQLLDRRNNSFSGFMDPQAAEHLTGLQGQVDEALAGLPGYELDLGLTEDMPDFINGEKFNYKDTDFRDTQLADLMDAGDGHFKSKTQQLAAIKTEIKSQLDAMRVSDEVTGFAPTQAFKVNKILPKDSVFKNPDGTIKVEKVREHLNLNADPTHEAFKVTYTGAKDLKPEEVAFLDITKDAITYETRGAYRAEKSKILEERKSEPKETDSPVGNEPKRPTGELLRNQYPGIYKNLRRKPEKSSFKTEDVLKLEGGAKGVPGALNREVKITENIGKKTKRQETWSEFVAKKQREWDAAQKRKGELAQADRAIAAKDKPLEFKLAPEEFQTASQRAYKAATDGVLEGISKANKIPKVPTNMRLTIKETFNETLRKQALEDSYQDTLLKIAELEAKNNDELALIYNKREVLEAQREALRKKLTEAKEEAYATVKVMRNQIGVDQVIQASQAPVEMTQRMVQLRIAGMRKNLQFTAGMFEGALKAGELVPAKIRESFANYFVRPTKLLSEQESILLRAMWESHTPVVIKAHLESLKAAMGKIPETERSAMQKAYRKGYDYNGPNAPLYDGVAKELSEVEDILNGRHQFYWSKSKDSPDIDHLKIDEIQRFLPSEYNFNMDDLFDAYKKRNKGTVAARVGTPFDKQFTSDYTIDDLITAISKSEYPNPQDMHDPFRLLWVMRMAADQAQQLRTLKHSMRETFGVPIPPREASKVDSRLLEKRKVIDTLRTEHGWDYVPELGIDTLFPPEAMNDINKLLEISKPGPAQSEISRLFDNAMGYWKQSMTIYNPGYYTRNGIGEIMASWLDGVNHPKWYRMSYRIHRFTKAEDHNLAELVKKWNVLEGQIPVDVAKGNELLFKLKNGTNVTIEDALRSYINMGLKSTFANTDLERGVRSLAGSGLADSKLGRVGKGINEGVHEAGEGFEDWLRMSHFLHAMQNSGKHTIEEAAKYARGRVVRSHFDYSDFSQFEKAVMLRAFPFYKWTRRGAPLMLAHLFMTPGKMTALPKAMDAMSGLGFDPMGMFTEDPILSTQDVSEDKNGLLPDYQGIAPAWVRDLFAYQMQPAQDDEYANYFRIQTPQIDGLNAAFSLLPKSGSSPMGMFGDSAGYPLLNPLLKAGLELPPDGMLPGSLGNKGLDPDFPYEIYGGDYNEMQGMHPVESLITYGLRNANPVAGFLGKLARNNALVGDFNLGENGLGPKAQNPHYKQDHGYDTERDVASIITGLGFYQGRPGAAEDPNTGTGDLVSDSEAPVGPYAVSELPMFSGRKAASETDDTTDTTDLESLVSSIVNNASNGSSGGGYRRGYRRGRGYRRYGGYGGGYGGGYRRDVNIWALIQALRDTIAKAQES